MPQNRHFFHSDKVDFTWYRQRERRWWERGVGQGGRHTAHPLEPAFGETAQFDYYKFIRDVSKNYTLWKQLANAEKNEPVMSVHIGGSGRGEEHLMKR